MTVKTARLAALAIAAMTLAPLPAAAEFLSPDWSTLKIEGVGEPDWIAGVRDGEYIGMCTGCDETLMLQVRTTRDDGTGERVRSGETNAATYTDLGKANAEKLGDGSAYYGTEDVEFASAVGFKTSARAATGDYSASYQLWDDGQQLIVRVFGKDQARVDDTAAKAFAAAAPLTFK